MTMKSMTLSVLMAGALLVPAFAFAEETKAPPADDPQPGMEAMMHKGLDEADTNKDGALSLDEFLARHKEKFAEIDADKNGSLSPEEMNAHGEARRAKMKEHHQKMMEQRKARGEAPAETKEAEEARRAKMKEHREKMMERKGEAPAAPEEAPAKE